MATLTYNYADSTAVLGPMARLAEPHTYDLCARHARTLTAPKGWELVRLELPAGHRPARDADDLLAVAEAVREQAPSPPPDETAGEGTGPSVRRGTGSEAGPRPEPISEHGPARPGDRPSGRPQLRLVPDVDRR